MLFQSITNGVEGVRRIVQWFRDNNHDGRHDDVVKGYHGASVLSLSPTFSKEVHLSGLLLDLIDCEPIYFQAVEITAGSRLLFHVVSDDRSVRKEKLLYQELLYVDVITELR